MKESDWRYLVDALLFICLVGMTFIGILLGLVVPAGPAVADTAKYFLGLHRHQWGNIHAYLSIVFVVLMIVHLVLSWKWIKAKTKQIFKRRATPALGAITALPVVVLFLFWIWTPRDAESFRSYGAGARENRRTPLAKHRESLPPVEPPVRQDDYRTPVPTAVPAFDSTPSQDSREEKYHARVGSVTITGRQTLRQLEYATGIPSREIARRIGLPEHASMDETLGRLRRIYGFEIQEVRDLVARLLEERDVCQD